MPPSRECEPNKRRNAVSDQPRLFSEPPPQIEGAVRRVTILKDVSGWMISVFTDDEPSPHFEVWLFPDDREKEGIRLAEGSSRDQALMRAGAELARLASVIWGVL